jgi:aminoethylphosphonate catabolism LysR family transcriptional regulator
LLHISQPTVTTQVKFLEETYGVELFYRRGHKVQLTPIGEQIYGMTRKIFSLEEDLIHLLEDSGELKTGQLRVGAVSPFHITEMLASFNREFPHIFVSMRVGNSQSVLDSLTNYETDVAVLAHFLDDPLLVSMPYRQHPVVIFANKKHPLARYKSVKLSRLHDEPMIMREEGSTTRKSFEDACKRHGVTPRLMMEIGSREAIREAVIKGVGLSIVSEAEYVADPEITMIRISDADIYTNAHVVCLRDRKEARLIRAFLDIAMNIQHDQRATTP